MQRMFVRLPFVLFGFTAILAGDQYHINLAGSLIETSIR